MKKVLLLAIVVISALSANAQAEKYLNFGGLGTGIYAGLEFPVASAITVGPAVYTDYNFHDLVLGAKGNFYFDDLFGLPSEWDVYGGINLGYRVDNNDDRWHEKNSGFNWGAQVGARWFWSDKWGLNLEFGGGSVANGGLGVTMKF